MADIIRDEGPGGRLGSALGQGLSEGLSYLAQHKLNEMAQQKLRQNQLPGLQSLFPNYNPQQLESLTYQDPGLLRDIYKSQARQPGEEAFAQSLASILGGASPEQISSNLGQPRLNAEQATKLAQISLQKQQADEARKLREAQFSETTQLKREKQESDKLQKIEQHRAQKQGKIDTANKPYLGMLQKGEELANNINSIADQLNALLDTGKVSSGIAGYTPRIAQNTETQQFEALSNDLASLIASNSGVATNFKIKFAQERKPNLKQKPETQRALVNKIKQEANLVLDRARIRDSLIDANEGKQPENIQSLINKYLKESKKENKQAEQESSSDAVYQDDNGNFFQIIDGKEVPIPAERVIYGS